MQAWRRVIALCFLVVSGAVMLEGSAALYAQSAAYPGEQRQMPHAVMPTGPAAPAVPTAGGPAWTAPPNLGVGSEVSRSPEGTFNASSSSGPLRCLVSLIEDVHIAAEESGVLMAVDVRPGDRIPSGMVLAKLDDMRAKNQHRVAVAEQQVAAEKASNDAPIRSATAARKVAETEYLINAEANRKMPGTKSVIEMKRLELLVEQSTLQIEQAEHERRIAALQAASNAARVDLAEADIARRQVKSPCDAEVVEVFFRPGEWVEAGNTVARLVRLDRLRIEGFINADTTSPAEIAGRTVRVSVRLAGGREELFTGRVVFVNPLLQAGGEYLIHAEVENRQEHGHWLLRPGHEVLMEFGAAPEVARQPQ